ncbi:MaoC like domain protein [Caballeronia sp. SBC1]|uniref:MaoC family dehydratase n=1 Tax=unclassified Caballeronia TaxID=2646786 RepID=UPI0013E1382F|nr:MULTISPECIES: MaoC/PaaZ C-terminal domain-containing protein [unclassified Caballeronia]QIE24166.1 MaoC like domain protein [Caballeronia sp. SBC2]QIN62062.1 MaoC like domain protein [Caballeronia sp. SBC1]
MGMPLPSSSPSSSQRMRTVILESLPPPVKLYGRALQGIFKRPERVAELPPLRLVRPGVALDPEQIGRYARVCGFIPEQGVPVTFPHVMAFPLHLMLLTDPAFPWPAMGLVHVSNSVRLRRTLHSGQSLRIEVESGALVAHDRGQAFTLHTRIYRGGEAVWDADSVYLKRGVAGRGHASVPQADHTSPMLVREARWQLPAQLGRDYAKASGDFNPIHLHALSAKAFGFPRAIAHGMWTLGRTLAALQPSKQLDAAHVQGDFKSPIFLPAETTLWTAASSPTERDFEVRDLAGERLHLRGRFEWELP